MKYPFGKKTEKECKPLMLPLVAPVFRITFIFDMLCRRRELNVC